jgi:co-chaperonin GroES (HSP10)
MTIVPLKNYVLLEEIQHENITDTGILLGDTVDREPTYKAKVLECGSDVSIGYLNPLFKNGDTVLIQKHLFNEITLDKKQYLIGKADGIMAVLHD